MHIRKRRAHWMDAFIFANVVVDAVVAAAAADDSGDEDSVVVVEYVVDVMKIVMMLQVE